MAGRLTEKDKYGNNAIFQNKDKFTIAKDKNNDIRVYGKAIDKLAQLEDIMEEYNCKDVEDLQKEFSMNKLLHETIAELSKMVTKAENDRDAWKRACELACDVILRFTDGCPCKADYFYQQAKKEG